MWPRNGISLIYKWNFIIDTGNYRFSWNDLQRDAKHVSHDKALHRQKRQWFDLMTSTKQTGLKLLPTPSRNTISCNKVFKSFASNVFRYIWSEEIQHYKYDLREAFRWGKAGEQRGWTDRMGTTSVCSGETNNFLKQSGRCSTYRKIPNSNSQLKVPTGNLTWSSFNFLWTKFSQSLQSG